MTRHYLSIDVRPVATERAFDVTNTATGRRCAEAPVWTTNQLDDTFAAVVWAQPGLACTKTQGIHQRRGM